MRRTMLPGTFLFALISLSPTAAQAPNPARWVLDNHRPALVIAAGFAGALAARLRVGGLPIRLGVGFGSVWVRDDSGRVLRIRPQR